MKEWNSPDMQELQVLQTESGNKKNASENSGHYEKTGSAGRVHNKSVDPDQILDVL